MENNASKRVTKENSIHVLESAQAEIFEANSLCKMAVSFMENYNTGLPAKETEEAISVLYMLINKLSCLNEKIHNITDYNIKAVC